MVACGAIGSALGFGPKGSMFDSWQADKILKRNGKRFKN